MCANELNDLLLVGDEYTQSGIDRGYYPVSLTSRVSVVDIDDKAALANVPFHGACRPALNCLYARDVYSNSYVMIMDDRQMEVDNSDIFVKSKAAALRGALQKMGAKRIVATNVLETFQSSDTGGGVRGGNFVARADINTRYSDDASMRYKSCLEIDIPNNTPDPEAEVINYMNVHFLRNSDLDLENLLDRMNKGKFASSSLTLTVDLFKEVNSILEIAAGLDIKLLGFKANFKRTTSNKTHQSMSLIVEF